MKTLYLDMDGVVADWDQRVEEIVGEPRPSRSHTLMQSDSYTTWGYHHWPKIREQARIYSQLPLVPQAEQLVDLARKFRDELDWAVLFLTAIPRNNDVPWAFWDKFKWVEQYFPDIPVHFGPYSEDKHLHCQPGDILVDDRWSNIDAWQRAGGRAIHVRSGEIAPAIAELEEIYRGLI